MAGRQSVDLNKADFEQLTRIEGINRQRAELILAYRREHGPFQSWDELRNVPGLGDSLVERAREAATLGEESGRAAESEDEEPDEPEEEEDDEAEALEMEEIEALAAIAQLDSEAAEAYAIAAESVASEELQKMLRAFGGDHRRHVEDLKNFMRDQGAKAEVSADGSSIVALAEAMGAIDQQASLEGVLANELMTNAVYETALWVVGNEQALEIVRRNREDEARHLQSLQAWADRHEDDED